MNKTDFIDIINEKTGIVKTDCKLCLETILETIKETLIKGESLTLSNFGKFKINETKAKPIYSFKTKMTEIVSPRKKATFIASDSLKQSIK